jgi:hypothetical protein
MGSVVKTMGAGRVAVPIRVPVAAARPSPATLLNQTLLSPARQSLATGVVQTVAAPIHVSAQSAAIAEMNRPATLAPLPANVTPISPSFHPALYGANALQKTPAQLLNQSLLPVGAAASFVGGSGGGSADSPSAGVPPTMPSLSPAALAPANNPNVSIASSMPAPMQVAPVAGSFSIANVLASRPWWLYAGGLGLLALAGWWLFGGSTRKSNPGRRFRKRGAARRRGRA